MGKMKSRRQKLHTSAVKLRKRDEAKKTSDSTNAAVEVVEMDSNTGVQGMLQVGYRRRNLSLFITQSQLIDVHMFDFITNIIDWIMN